MKKILLLLLIVLFAIPFIAQDWAPIGANWHFSEEFSFWNEYDEDYIKFESVKDTLIEGKSCRKITKRHQIVCNDRPNIEYMYSENGKVYFFDPNFNTFQMLYDFDAEQFDSWMILIDDILLRNADTLNIIVDSIDIIDINGSELKQFYVTYQFIYDYFNEGNIDTLLYNSRIIENIGDVFYMFNYTPAWAMTCDGNFSKGLRCYEDTILGFYETGIADSCDYRHFYTDNIEEPPPIYTLLKLFPNPTTGLINIQKIYPDLTIKSLTISNLLGVSESVYYFHDQLNINLLPDGIYFIRIELTGGQIINKKVLKKTS